MWGAENRQLGVGFQPKNLGLIQVFWVQPRAGGRWLKFVEWEKKYDWPDCQSYFLTYWYKPTLS
jgi:hypothetical protein